MSSTALTEWQTNRNQSLLVLEDLCKQELAKQRSASAGTECQESYVVHLCGHFQGFCRDLYTECTQLCVAAATSGMQAAIRAQFYASLRLDTGNPTKKNICIDFDRFGTPINVENAVGDRSHLLSDLTNVIRWRNHIVHRIQGSHPDRGPKALKIKLLQKWKSSRDELADAIDSRIQEIMTSILGTSPW